MNTSEEFLIRVAVASSPFKVAGAIAAQLRQHSTVTVQSIGAGALNQAIKAIIYARRYIAQDHLDLVVVPGFSMLVVEAQDCTAIRLLVIACPAPTP